VIGVRGRQLTTKGCNLCGSREAALVYRIEEYHIVRCAQCYLVYVLEDVGSDQLQSYYTQEYYTGGQKQGYADYFGRRERRKQYFRSAIPTIKRYLAIPSPRVLDVGCAAGFFLEVVREEGWEGYGVETSSYASEYARAQFGLNVYTGTLAEAGLAAATFDLVSFWDVIEHLRDPLETLRLSNRLLQRGGLLIISTGDISGATARLYGRRWALLAPPGHLFYFSRKTLAAMLRQAGFEPVAWQSDGTFLVNDADAASGSGRSLIRESIVRIHGNRWVNALLRRLRLGSIMTVYSRKSRGC